MKKRIFGLLLALVMLVGMIPMTSLPVFAAATDSVWVGGVKMYDGDYLAVDATATQTTKPSGGYAYYKNGTLTLDNYRYIGEGYSYLDDGIPYSAIIYASNDIQIELVGTNTLTQQSDTNTACIWGDANVSLTGEGTLSLLYALWGIICKSDLSIESVNLTVYSCKFGIYSANQEVIINGGSFKIDAINCAVYGHRGIEINGGSGIFQKSWDSVYRVLDSRIGTVTIDPSLNAMASTVNGELGEYVAANLASYTKIVITGKPPVVPYVIAKSTEPIAGTLNNTPPTITFDPEYHCKVSDYMTGYWMYYDEKAGYKKKMEDNTKFQVDEDYYYVVAVETTDGYTFPADGGEVTGIVMCDSATYAVQTDRVAGRDDVVIMTIWYFPCTYGAPLEFSEQTPVADFTTSLYEMEGILGQEYLFRFNHKPLTDAQKAKGFSVERTLRVFEGSLTNVVYDVANDTGTQPLSYNLTIDQAQTYLVAMMITLKKDGTTLQSKGGVYQIKVVAGGTPVIFTADSSNSFGGTVTVDIEAMAKKDANLKTALDNGTVKYQWYRDASQIPDADGQSYTFHADDVGKKIKVAVLYGNSGSISEPFTVGGTAPSFTTQPAGGDVAPGANLTVSWALSFTPTKIVVDKYNFAGLASEYATLSDTATSTELPANEYGYVIKAYYNDTDYIESNKFTVKEKEAPSFLLGDVDGDGNITSTDARMTLQYYAGKIGEESLNTAVADVDSDGQITSTDARLILQYYAGKIEKFPAT